MSDFRYNLCASECGRGVCADEPRFLRNQGLRGWRFGTGRGSGRLLPGAQKQRSPDDLARRRGRAPADAVTRQIVPRMFSRTRLVDLMFSPDGKGAAVALPAQRDAAAADRAAAEAPAASRRPPPALSRISLGRSPLVAPDAFSA